MPAGFLFENQFVSVNDIKGIWNRKYAAPYSFEVEHHPENAAYLKEAHLLLFNFLNSNPAFSLDPLTNAIAAENKPLQLKMAHEAGLKIPPTIFSNNPEQIFNFLELHQDQVVVKMQGVLSWSMEGNSDFFYTRKISRSDLSQSKVLSIYPLIYQKLIEKAYELRIIYVDGECFCGKIPPLPSDIIDWRKPGVQFNWQKSTLPMNIQSGLIKLMDRLRIKFGAIDIIKSIDGDYYFLEVNPTGEWGMLEKNLGLPISKSIAKTLIKYT